jgi:hypothetical protein
MKPMRLILTCALIGLVGVACKKTEAVPPEDMITGKWVVDEAEVLGATADGDGSYIVFDQCAGLGVESTGSDYSADDSISGPLSYVLSEDLSTLTITDTAGSGDNWDATWDILELSNSRLRMITNSIFGTIKYEFSKE